MLQSSFRSTSLAVGFGALVLLGSSVVAACGGASSFLNPPSTSTSINLSDSTGQRPAPLASLTPSVLRFSAHCVVLSITRCYGVTRGAATLTNVGTAPLHVAHITVSRGFTVSSDCSSTLRPGQHCSISITWNPLSGSGLRRLDVYDDAKNSPQQVSLIAFVTFCPPSCP